MGADGRNPPLRILVVEDESILALDLEDLLAELGCEVIGPVPTVARALTLLAGEVPDFALLDVNLGRERSTPIAEALHARAIPFALLTGYDARQLPEPVLRTAPRLGKPVTPVALRRLLVEHAGL